MPLAVAWALVSLAALCTGAVLTNIAMLDFTDSHVETNTYYKAVPVDSSVLFPTVKICPVQFYDRFNLQRVLLNDINVKNASGHWKESVLQDFQVRPYL